MATIRRIFAGALLVLGMVVLGATTAWLLVEDATLVSLLVKRLETASDTRISYLEGATISRTWAPELIFSDLVVDDSEGRYRFETSSLQLKVSLPSLLAGRVDIPHLLLGNTRVHTRKSATAAAPDVAERPPLDLSALRLRPVLHEMQIAELSLVVEGEEFQLPMTRVSGLSVRMDTEANVARLSAELELADETFSIKATLPVLAQALKRNELPFSVWVQGTMTESSAVGQIDFGQPVAVLEAELKGRFPDLNRVPGLNGQLSIPGELTASALLSGPVDQLAVKDLVADWTGPGQSGAKLSGQIANVAKFEGAELALAGQLAHPDWLTAILPASLGALNSADLAARISGDLTRLTLQAFDFQARSTDELDLSLTGQLDLVQPLQALEAENLDLKLAFSAPTTRAARILIFDDIPEFGAISGAADIHSTRGEPALDNIGIQIRDESGIEVDLSGRIAQFPLSDAPNTGYDLDVSMKADQTALMAERAGLELPLAGPLDLSYRIEGDTQALELNQIKLAAGDKSQTLVGAEGRLHFGDWDQPDPIESMDLTVRMSGRDTGFVSAFTKQELPALAYQSQARLHTVDGQHRVDDYKLTTPKGEPLDVWEKGSADKVTFLPAFSMEGIRLDHRARTDDVAKLNALFKLDGKIPAVGRLDMRAIITGTDRKLLIDQLELSAGDEDVLRVRANGRLGYISAEKKWRLENTDLELEARSSSSQALAQAFGYEIPDLGPVEAQSSIHDRDKTLGIEGLRLLVGEAERPALIATGSIGDVYALSKVRIETDLNLDGRGFARLADTQELPELGALTGRMLISDSQGALGIDSLHIESAKQDLLTLKLNGRYDDFSRPETFELNLKATARDANLLWALVDLEWPGEGRAELDAHIRRSNGGSRLDATMVSGAEKVDIVLRTDFQASPPKIRGRVTAENFFLPDPAEKHLEKIASKRDKNKKKRSKQREPVFSREPMDLSWMKKADVDLNIEIRSFDRAHSEALSGKGRVQLKSGRLSVKPATIVYREGQADLELQLDARKTPALSFSLSGENLDPWRGLNLYQPEVKGSFHSRDAELDINVALASTGESPHQMAANAQGEFYVAMREGQISQSKLRLLFVDVVGWATDRAKARYDNVNCLIADYSIDQGLVSTNAFFMDTDSITIAGQGTLDLGREQVDYTFIPRKKSRLILKAEPVKIRGPLNDPSIKAIPVKSAALTFGTLIFAPYVFAGMVAADFAQGELNGGKGDASVCANYVKDLKKAREKEASKKNQAKNKERWERRLLPFWDDE